MTVPFFIEEPYTSQIVSGPYDIVQYCDSFTVNVDREDLSYIDCVWMHMGYYGTPAHVMRAVRNEWNPPVNPVFE